MTDGYKAQLKYLIGNREDCIKYLYDYGDAIRIGVNECDFWNLSNHGIELINTRTGVSGRIGSITKERLSSSELTDKPQLRYTSDCSEESMKILAKHGKTTELWINEGDIWGLFLQGIELVDLSPVESATLKPPPDSSHLKLPLPWGMTRVETQTIQFGDDWPGMFLRGDYAIPMAEMLASLLEAIDKKGPIDPTLLIYLQGLVKTLNECRIGKKQFQ